MCFGCLKYRLIETVLMRPTTYVLVEKKKNFQLHTLIWVPDSFQIAFYHFFGLHKRVVLRAMKFIIVRPPDKSV